MKISVILAVYNEEQNITAAIDSVRGQSYQDWELIVVDDGSTDRTGAICDEVVRQDGRIRVIHTENFGQGIARNTGLSMAMGEYVWFVDADDTLEPEGMVLLAKNARQHGCDVIAALYYRAQEGKKNLISGNGSEGLVKRRGTKQEQERFHQIKSESIFGYLWNKLYRRQFLLQHGLELDDIRKIYMEDQLFNLKVFSKNPVYYLCCEPVYCYHVQNNSTTRRLDPAIAEKNRAMLDAYYGYLLEQHVLAENMDLLTALSARVCCWSLVKNIPDEGMHYKKIRTRLQTFLEADSFQAVLKHENCYHYLRLLPKKLQCLGYCGIFFLLRNHASGLVCAALVCTYPVLKWYIGKTVK